MADKMKPPDSFMGKPLRHRFRRVRIECIADDPISLERLAKGQSVTCVPQPDDSGNAAAVFSEDGRLIGYLPQKSKLNGLILDWHRSRDPVWAKICRLKPDHNPPLIRLSLAFYRSPEAANDGAGDSQENSPSAEEAPPRLKSRKNRWLALVLCLFLGLFGVHRFYVGKWGTGLIWMLTGGLGCMGWMVDLVMIASGRFTDKAGIILK